MFINMKKELLFYTFNDIMLRRMHGDYIIPITKFIISQEWDISPHLNIIEDVRKLPKNSGLRLQN